MYYAMETKVYAKLVYLLQRVFMEGLQQKLGYNQLVTVEPVGLSGGLAVMWKDSYSVSILSADRRIIDMEVTFGSIKFFSYMCVWGSCQSKHAGGLGTLDSHWVSQK